MEKFYREMTDDEFKVAGRRIVETSFSEQEVKDRLKNELLYPYIVAITTHIPKDDAGRKARSIAQGLGGLMMKNGAMAMVMVFGKSGTMSL